MEFQEKVDELQAEIAALDQKMSTDNGYAKMLFLIGIAVPFVWAILLYITGFKFVRTDGNRDRKKIVKWTLLLTIISWVVLVLLKLFWLK